MPGKKSGKKQTRKPTTKKDKAAPRLEDYSEAGNEGFQKPVFAAFSLLSHKQTQKVSAYGPVIPSLVQLWAKYTPEVWYGKGGAMNPFVLVKKHY